MPITKKEVEMWTLDPTETKRITEQNQKEAAIRWSKSTTTIEEHIKSISKGREGVPDNYKKKDE